MTLATNIKLLRENYGMSQTELGEACGLDKSVISRIENSDTTPRRATIAKLSTYFNVDVMSKADVENKVLGRVVPSPPPKEHEDIICPYCHEPKGFHLGPQREANHKYMCENCGKFFDAPKLPVVPDTPVNVQPTPEIPGIEILAKLMSGELQQQLTATLHQNQGLEANMRDLVKRLTNADRSIVKEVLREIIASEVERKELPQVEWMVEEATAQHRNTPLLMAAVENRLPIWMYGEAGSGKTTAAGIVAKQKGLPFAFISVCPTSTQSQFLGYMDATGTYRRTIFRDVFENGGVFLFDEIDNGNPSILAVMNTALANGECAFPDGIIQRHKDCILMAAANTIGRGANSMYVGRNAIDAATLDRFVYIPWDIDENLESALMGENWTPDICDVTEGGSTSGGAWLKTVRTARAKAVDLGLKHIISTRAALYGAKLAASGVGKTHLLEMLVYKGLSDGDKTKLKGAMS
jgi:cobaltochelatase CobS